MIQDLRNHLTGKRILITGGLGMIGSTIARKAVAAGAHVTIVDACIEPYGANSFNIADIRDRLEVNINDIRDRESMKILVRDRDIIFNLAGQVSHNDSLEDPFLDTDINYLGHLIVLEAVRKFNAGVVIVHAGSRLQYGAIKSLPVDENHPLRPLTPYALNKTAAENTYRYYHEVHGIRTISFRISNPYGPRSQMKHSKYSIINWFIRQAMEGKAITVFGDGSQVRDYLYVEDLADAFLSAAVNSASYGNVYNVGSGVGVAFRDMARCVVDAVGQGSVEFSPWPESYLNVETGDYIADISRLQRTTGWAPQNDLLQGLDKTVAFYRKWRAYYW